MFSIFKKRSNDKNKANFKDALIQIELLFESGNQTSWEERHVKLLQLLDTYDVKTIWDEIDIKFKGDINTYHSDERTILLELEEGLNNEFVKDTQLIRKEYRYDRWFYNKSIHDDIPDLIKQGLEVINKLEILKDKELNFDYKEQLINELNLIEPNVITYLRSRSFYLAVKDFINVLVTYVKFKDV